MTQNINQLINAYLDGIITQDQQAELAAWIEADSTNADDFAEAVFLDSRLHAEVNAAPYTDPAKTIRKPDSHASTRQLSTKTTIRLAICLLITVAVGVMAWVTQNDPQQLATDDGEQKPAAFASVSQVVDAQWSTNDTLHIGDRLNSQTIQLKSGFLTLTFDDGVEVTLQGPAEYELLAAGRTKLTTGLLTATVPPGAEGFTVDTPTAEVVDLGTSFGIDLREDGFSSISVFDGEVTVAVPDTAKKHLLAEGDSVRVGADQEIQKVDFDPDRFEKVWPVSSGIVGSTDTFRFVPPWPRRIRLIESDEDIFVATEGYAVELTTPLFVNISAPGKYVRTEDLTPLELPRGQTVRSFILHQAPTSNVGRRRAERVSGSITFDRPILGLIVRHEELLASSGRFTRRHFGEAQPRRQIEFTGDSDGDRIVVSDDRKTVTLDVISRGRSSDLVRVIIDGETIRSRPLRRRQK